MTTISDQEQILRDRLNKIRALLASAEDDSYPPEIRERYNAKAAELLVAYGIDRALLFEADRSTDVVGDLVIHIPNPFFSQKSMILGVVATQFGCRAVQRRVNNGGEVHLFGFESDLERVDLLFTSLLIQAGTGINRRVPARGANAATYRRSYLMGFAYEIGKRLEAANKTGQEQAKAAGRSTDLVLADRQHEVDRRVSLAYPRLRSLRSKVQIDRGAVAEGRAAGARADLGQTRVNSNTRNPALPGSR